MKDKYIEKFEEMLYNELVKKHQSKNKYEIIKKFKKTNPKSYIEKMNTFFDEIHPY